MNRLQKKEDIALHSAAFAVMFWIPTGPIWLRNLKSELRRVSLFVGAFIQEVMQSSVQLLLRLDMQPTSITANLKVTVCSCSPANNMDRSRSEDVRNAEGGIPKGKSKFGPFYTFEHLSGGGGGCQSSSYSEMCLRNVYSVDRSNFIHSFFTFKLSKQQVYKTYIGFYYTSSFYHCCLNSHRVSLSVCLSVCLYVCCSRGGEIFVLWTVKLEL